MEKIQHALEKARHDRAAALGGGSIGGALPAAAAPPRPAPGGAAPPPARAPGRPVLGVAAAAAVPLRPASPALLRRHRVVAAAPAGGPAVEAFRILRAHLLERLAATGGRSLAVTSPRQREGKSFVAANLAVVLAQQVERGAVLVDADLRRPSLARLLGLDAAAGDLSDYLLGRRPLDACLVRPGLEDLVVLPQRGPVRRSSELLGSPPMAALAEELKRRFPDRVIVYDCPPLLAVDDPLVVRRLVDGVLLVAQEGATTRADLARAAELVGEERYLGSVLNHARWHAPLRSHYRAA